MYQEHRLATRLAASEANQKKQERANQAREQSAMRYVKKSGKHVIHASSVAVDAISSRVSQIRRRTSRRCNRVMLVVFCRPHFIEVHVYTVLTDSALYNMSSPWTHWHLTSLRFCLFPRTGLCSGLHVQPPGVYGFFPKGRRRANVESMEPSRPTRRNREGRGASAHAGGREVHSRPA